MQITPQQATKEELDAMEKAKKVIKVKDVLAEQAHCEEMMIDYETQNTNRQLNLATATLATHEE